MSASRQDCPVKLVVFDFDETLTLATFMTGNCEYADDEACGSRSAVFDLSFFW